MADIMVLSQDDLNTMVNNIINGVAKLLAGGGNAQQGEKLYNNKQACAYLNVCSKTLQNYRDNGLIRFTQVGRKISYSQQDLNIFLNKNKIENNDTKSTRK